MKKAIALVLFMCIQFVSAQNERVAIETTLLSYINGSSYNQTVLLKSAFAEDATLYLKSKNNQLRIVSPETYVGWFKKAKLGEFNGRVGKVISIDVEDDIATAKIEILFTTRGEKYIDFFLLSKKKNGWKIISKTAAGRDSDKKGDKILFIVSNAHFYGNTKLKTGNSFSEIVNAYDTFVKAGYTVDFVSPEGGAIPLAYINTSDDLSKSFIYNEDFMYALKYTKLPKEIIAADYKAVHYIGGGSAMFDVPENKEIQKIAMDVYEKHQGIISSVCHGTAGIVHLKTSNGQYLVNGKRVNGYPDDYENLKAPHVKEFPFLIKKTIVERGGNFKFSNRNTPHVEVDGRLITGQNYLSSKPVALKIIELLQRGR